MRTAYVGSVSDHRAENGTTKYPESLCLTLALPPSGRRGPPPAGTLLPGHRRDLPDVISVNPSLCAWAPVTAVPQSAHACFFLHVISLPPYTIEVGFPHCSRRNDFMTDRFFETAAISLCSGPQVCSPPRSFLPLRLIAAEQPRLLRPSRTCFVASACIGYANHPPRQIGGVGTYTPRDSQPCRLLQRNRDISTIGVSIVQSAKSVAFRHSVL
jgi:hypothetical protein